MLQTVNLLFSITEQKTIAGPKEHNAKYTPQHLKKLKNHKLTPQEEEAYLRDIVERAQDENSDLSEILNDIDTLVKYSPSTPKNLNFTLRLRKVENDIRENVTNLILNYQKTKTVPKVMNEMTRYKRSNNTCYDILTTIGSYGGAAAGGALLGALFSIIPVIGTAIGMWLGGTLGQRFGLQISQSIANSSCPK